MNSEVNKTIILTNSGNERQSFDFQIWVIHLKLIFVIRPALYSKGAECEHGFVKVYNLGLWLIHILQEWVHSEEQCREVRLSEVNLRLTSLNLLKLDFVLDVNIANGWRRDLSFTEFSVKELSTFCERHIGTFLKSGGGDKIRDVMRQELTATRSLVWITILRIN